MIIENIASTESAKKAIRRKREEKMGAKEKSFQEIEINEVKSKGMHSSTGLSNEVKSKEVITNEVKSNGKILVKSIAPLSQKDTLEDISYKLDYKKVLDLIRKTGQVAAITAHEVYSKDKFEHAYGLEEKLVHIPSGEEELENITHFYSCYKLKSGMTGFVIMTKNQIDENRDMVLESKGALILEEKDDYIFMGLKTVLLKLIKYIPISIEGGDVYGNF